MQDILRELFDHYYEGKIGSHPMTKKERAVWDRAQAVLGEDYIDRMVYAQSRSISEGHYDSFRLGFRLGAQLMLDLHFSGGGKQYHLAAAPQRPTADRTSG